MDRSHEIATERSKTEALHFSGFGSSDVEVFIKRDDLIHPLISGNKWRKLHLQLEAARQAGKDTLVSFGGAYSNHLVATACAGNLFGFKTVAFTRGDETRPKNHYDLLCDFYGMDQVPVSREAYRDKALLFENYFSGNRHAYFIDEGGAGELGSKGCEAIVEELHEVFDFICLPVGTATTMKGITDAIINRQLHTKVLGFSTMKNNHSLDNLMQHADKTHWHIFHEYHRGAYGKIDKELLEFIRRFTRETGLLADPVYMGKMLMGLQDLLQQGYFAKGSKILCVHTGGNLGLFSETVVNMI